MANQLLISGKNPSITRWAVCYGVGFMQRFDWVLLDGSDFSVRGNGSPALRQIPKSTSS